MPITLDESPSADSPYEREHGCPVRDFPVHHPAPSPAAGRPNYQRSHERRARPALSPGVVNGRTVVFEGPGRVPERAATRTMKHKRSPETAALFFWATVISAIAAVSIRRTNIVPRAAISSLSINAKFYYANSEHGFVSSFDLGSNGLANGFLVGEARSGIFPNRPVRRDKRFGRACAIDHAFGRREILVLAWPISNDSTCPMSEIISGSQAIVFDNEMVG
jgi:hypothetical protein